MRKGEWLSAVAEVPLSVVKRGMATAQPFKLGSMPKPVMAFEWLSVAVLALEIMTGAGVAAGSAFFDTIWLLLMLGLVLAITRGRRRWSRWAFTMLYAVGFAVMIYIFSKGVLSPGGVTAIAWLLLAASIVQLALLWHPTTTAWLGKPRSPAG
jgi:hypothetical protein